MKVTVTIIRPYDDLEKNVLCMSDEEIRQRSSNIYREFREVWEKDDGDEASLTKRLVFRLFTGRELRYLDRVTPEMLEDLGLQDEPAGVVYLTMPEDFTVRRFRLRAA